MRIRGLFLFRRYHIPAFVIVLLLSGLILISLRIKQRTGVAFFDAFLMELTAPVQSGATSVIKGVQGVFHHYLFLIHAEKENEALKKRVKQLEDELKKLKK